jgi:hypothetical protein
MNQEIKTEWVRRLRSGDYLQGQGKLRIDNGETRYCCLGVLCEMAVEAGILTRIPAGYLSVAHADEGSWDTILSPAVQQWAGIAGDSAKISVPEGTECPNLGEDAEPETACGEGFCHICGDASLVDLNDEVQASFEQIADVIEKWF